MEHLPGRGQPFSLMMSSLKDTENEAFAMAFLTLTGFNLPCFRFANRFVMSCHYFRSSVVYFYIVSCFQLGKLPVAMCARNWVNTVNKPARTTHLVFAAAAAAAKGVIPTKGRGRLIVMQMCRTLKVFFCSCTPPPQHHHMQGASLCPGGLIFGGRLQKFPSRPGASLCIECACS